MPDEIKIDYPDVLRAARRLVAEAGNSTERSAGWWGSYELPHLLAKRLGVSEARAQANTGRLRAAVARFDRQASRAFNEMAAEGTLIKIGRGERSPQGQVLGNEAEFYTPAAHAQAVSDMVQRLIAENDTRQLWERVYDRLNDAGLAPVSDRGRPIDLPLPVWGKLLGRLD